MRSFQKSSKILENNNNKLNSILDRSIYLIWLNFSSDLTSTTWALYSRLQSKALIRPSTCVFQRAYESSLSFLYLPAPQSFIECSDSLREIDEDLNHQRKGTETLSVIAWVRELRVNGQGCESYQESTKCAWWCLTFSVRSGIRFIF